MKVHTLFKFVLFVFVLVAKPAMAYNIYNNADRAIHISDHSSFSGISTIIPAHGKVSCNPTAKGCSGHLHLVVTAATKNSYKILCKWYGNIKGRGNYFVINKSSCPETWCQEKWCQIELHHD